MRPSPSTSPVSVNMARSSSVTSPKPKFSKMDFKIPVSMKPVPSGS